MFPTPSLEATETVSQMVAKTANRVNLENLKTKIAQVEFHHPSICPHMTVAFVQMRNGYVVIGKSAPADPANFNLDLGQQFAFEDAVRQIWPMEGYVLREDMHRAENPDPRP